MAGRFVRLGLRGDIRQARGERGVDGAVREVGAVAQRDEQLADVGEHDLGDSVVDVVDEAEQVAVGVAGLLGDDDAFRGREEAAQRALVLDDPDVAVDIGDLRQPVIQRNRASRLMQTVDHINQDGGYGTLRYAAESFQKKWWMKHEHRSNRYTTVWEELLTVKAN